MYTVLFEVHPSSIVFAGFKCRACKRERNYVIMYNTYIKYVQARKTARQEFIN